MRLHSCEIRVQRNFKETTSHVQSQTADCYCMGDVEGRGCEWKQSSRDVIDSFSDLFPSLLSSVLPVQHEHGEPVQIRAADALQHPGGRTGGPGPGHRRPQGTQNSSNDCFLLKDCPVMIASCQGKPMEKSSTASSFACHQFWWTVDASKSGHDGGSHTFLCQ